MKSKIAILDRKPKGLFPRKRLELDHLYQKGPVGLCVMDCDLRYIRINERLAEVNGKPVEEHIGRTLREVIPDIAEKAEPLYRKVIESGEPIVEVEVHGKTFAQPDPEKFCLVSYYPLKSDDGIVEGVSTILQDITDLKRAGNALRESQKQLRQVIDLVPHMIFAKDRTGKFLLANEAVAKAYNIPVSELVGKRHSEIHGTSEELDQILADDLDVLEGGQPKYIPAEAFTDHRGNLRTFQTIRIPFTESGSHEPAMLGVAVDVTELKKMEDALRRSEERLRLLLETTNAIPWEADAETWRFTYVGPQAVKLLGYPIELWYQDGFWVSHIHSEDREYAIDFCQKSATAGKDYEFEYRMVAEDGKTVWLHDLVSVVSENGRPMLLRGFIIDISRRKRAELMRAGQNRILELFSKGSDLEDVLDALARNVESQHDRQILCSILLLDEKRGVLRHGAAPSLPQGYNDAIDGTEIGPDVGSCGSAAYRGELVVVNDIATDPRWSDYRDLALRFDLRACWSQPILSESGQVLGTFAMYYNQPYQPSEAELDLIEKSAHLAGVAIERTRANSALRQSQDALKESHQDLQYLTGKLISAQEEERRRLARDLHDDLTQRLAVIAIEAGKLEQEYSSSEDAVSRRLGAMKEQIVNLSADVHTLSRQLHPSILDDLGLIAAIKSECEKFSEREGIQVRFEPGNVPETLPRDVSLCIYRVTQESLRNIAKHSRAQDAVLTLTGTDGSLVLSIEDSGTGFDPPTMSRKGGLGLASMEERVRIIQGTLSVKSRQGRGTLIEVRTPLNYCETPVGDDLMGDMNEKAAPFVGRRSQDRR